MGSLDDADDPVFRAALDEATRASNQFQLSPITGDVERVAAAYHRHVKALRCASRSRPRSDPASPDVNCHAYSLGLYATPEFQAKLGVSDDEFISHLISSEVLVSRALDQAQDDDIVLYRFSGQVTHSGRLMGQLIRSKWGEGSLFEHTPLAVPARYGSELKIFRRPSLDQVVPIYLSRRPAT